MEAQAGAGGPAVTRLSSSAAHSRVGLGPRRKKVTVGMVIVSVVKVEAVVLIVVIVVVLWVGRRVDVSGDFGQRVMGWLAGQNPYVVGVVVATVLVTTGHGCRSCRRELLARTIGGGSAVHCRRCNPCPFSHSRCHSASSWGAR